MAAVIAWLQVNWMPLLVALLAVDQVLVGIFPSVALFGSLADVLRKLLGPGQPPALK